MIKLTKLEPVEYEYNYATKTSDEVLVEEKLETFEFSVQDKMTISIHKSELKKFLKDILEDVE